MVGTAAATKASSVLRGSQQDPWNGQGPTRAIRGTDIEGRGSRGQRGRGMVGRASVGCGECRSAPATGAPTGQRSEWAPEHGGRAACGSNAATRQEDTGSSYRSARTFPGCPPSSF